MLRAWTVGLLWLIGVGAPTGVDDSRELELRAAPATEEVEALPINDRLDDGDVLRIRVDGGIAEAAGHVRQCAQLDATICFNTFPVQFDSEGAARFQYQLQGRDQCGPAGSCVVVVSDDEDERIAMAATVFGGAGPARPHVAVTPDGPYRAGDVVRVDVSGVAPGARVDVAFCGSDCGATVSSSAGSSGASSTDLRIGSNCRDCHISVSAGVHRIIVPIEFGTTRYDGLRLAVGLLVAAMLLAIVGRLIVAVDWRPPSEADAPELDIESSS
jgi:hypothetical protein